MRVQLTGIQTHHDHLVVQFDTVGEHRCWQTDLYPCDHPALGAAWEELQEQAAIALETVMIEMVGGLVVPDAVPVVRGMCRICDTVVSEQDEGVIRIGNSLYCATHNPDTHA